VTTRAPADQDDPEKRVAARLRELRRGRGLTLATLAEWTGISAAHLSRMEKGERQPSIGSLIQLARAYGVSLGELVGDERPREHHVVRGAAAPVHDGPDGPYAMMTGLGPRSALEAVRLELTADRPERTAVHAGEEWVYVVRGAAAPVHEGPDGPYAMMTGLGPRSALEAVRLELTADRPERTAVHAGEEWVYVVRGRIVARVGEEEVALVAGDALHFDAAARHSLWSRDEPATVLIVSVAPPPGRPPHSAGA
jgi:transcriptional regulator with XRE-family HTH domain